MSAGDEGEWLRRDYGGGSLDPIDPELGLELLEEVVASRSELFRPTPSEGEAGSVSVAVASAPGSGAPTPLTGMPSLVRSSVRDTHRPPLPSSVARLACFPVLPPTTRADCLPYAPFAAPGARMPCHSCARC